jgi:hypothetical protein
MGVLPGLALVLALVLRIAWVFSGLCEPLEYHYSAGLSLAWRLASMHNKQVFALPRQRAGGKTDAA